ncbi:MAG: hypothetical protein MUP92_01035 [Actinobacteria bacterium]|nr:hypothetical protein [Actinomycetota bacterium]
MKRTFWLGAGLAAGATGAVLASRWAKKQAQRMAPTHIAKEMQGDVVDLSKRLADSIAAGKAAMEDREREIHSQIDDGTAGSAPLD